MPHIATDSSFQASRWVGLQGVGRLCPSLLSSICGAGIGAFNKRTPRRGAVRFGTVTFTLPATPLGLWPSRYTRPGQAKSPTLIPQERSSKDSGPELSQQNSHSRHLDPPGFGSSSTPHSGLRRGGTGYRPPGKDRTAQRARGSPGNTSIMAKRPEAAPLRLIPPANWRREGCGSLCPL